MPQSDEAAVAAPVVSKDKPHKDSTPLTETISAGQEGYRPARIKALKHCLKAMTESPDDENPAELKELADEIATLEKAEKDANS